MNLKTDTPQKYGGKSLPKTPSAIRKYFSAIDMSSFEPQQMFFEKHCKFGKWFSHGFQLLIYQFTNFVEIQNTLCVIKSMMIEIGIFWRTL